MGEYESKDFFDARLCFKGDEEKVTSLLDSYVQKTIDLKEINNVISLYHTKLFFDMVEEIPSWTKDKYDRYKSISSGVIKEIHEFFVRLQEEEITDSFSSCNIRYKDDYLKFFFQYQVYERINKDHFCDIVKRMKLNPYKILSDKKFVLFFDEEITKLLELPEYGAELLVNYYLGEHKKPLAIYLPPSLTPEKKSQIIHSYIESTHPNGNYLYLIMHGRSSKEFPIDDRMKCKAKKAYEAIWNNPELSIIKQEYGASVSFGKDLPDKKVVFENGSVIAEYNINWIKDNKDYPTLLNNFIYLFEYTDSEMRCLLTSVDSQMGAFEECFVSKGKTIYKYGQSFNIVNGLANLQMRCYQKVLEDENIYLEEIIKWFFEEYLKNEFSVEGFVCSLPPKTDSLLSKYIRLASVMDGIKKQFKLYCEDGKIDRELYEISSSQIRYKDIPSFVKSKYAYCNGEDLKREITDVFSDQSRLSYIEKTKGRHNTFCELIIREKISIEDFYIFQRSEIEWLIQRGIVIRKDDTLKFNFDRLLVLSELYHKGVICLQYFQSESLKKLIQRGEVVVESTLLSRFESNYFDFYLNCSEFTNGLDLRNKYIHDTETLDEKTQQSDYIILLKLMIILIIKINEEFCFREKYLEGGSDYYEL